MVVYETWMKVDPFFLLFFFFFSKHLSVLGIVERFK